MIFKSNYHYNEPRTFGLAVSEVDKKDITLSRCFKDNECSRCSKKIGHGTWVIGRSYQKICMDCSRIYFKELTDDLDKVKQMILDEIKRMEDNADKIKADNMVANLKL